MFHYLTVQVDEKTFQELSIDKKAYSGSLRLVDTNTAVFNAYKRKAPAKIAIPLRGGNASVYPNGKCRVSFCIDRKKLPRGVDIDAIIDSNLISAQQFFSNF